MNFANSELCQELYDLSGWLTGMDGYYYVSPTGKGTGFEVRTLTDTENDRARVFPAYDLGSLLRRLPPGNVLTSLEDEWIASSSPKVATAANPEDAAAKLAIELFKHGILQRGGDEA